MLVNGRWRCYCGCIFVGAVFVDHSQSRMQSRQKKHLAMWLFCPCPLLSRAASALALCCPVSLVVSLSLSSLIFLSSTRMAQHAATVSVSVSVDLCLSACG